MSINHALLPSVGDARLPAAYEAAKVALKKCSRMDECKDWADKMAALASYARQSEDKSLMRAAVRISARATQRVGELLDLVDSGTGAHLKRGGAPPLLKNRKRAAAEAGLSADQAKTALRVANVPKDLFEELVESENPPTVTALAEQGTKPPEKKKQTAYEKLGMTEEAFQAGMEGWGAMRQYAGRISPLDPQLVVDGTEGYRRPELIEYMRVMDEWHVKLKKILKI